MRGHLSTTQALEILFQVPLSSVRLALSLKERFFEKNPQKA
jgi:hypothetical protein